MKFLALALLAPALAANVTVSPVACARDVINASKDVARASVQIASATNDCPLDDKTDCLADIDAIVAAVDSLASHVNAAVSDCGSGVDSPCGDDIVLIVDDLGDLTSAVSKAVVYCADDSKVAQCAIEVTTAATAVASAGVHIDAAVSDCQ